MKFHIDTNADPIYFFLDASKVIESEEINPGIVLDFNNHNHVVGIEILAVRDQVLRADLLLRLLVEGGQ